MTGFGGYHHRKNLAVGGRERARRGKYRVMLSDGGELELEGPFRCEGHVRQVAQEYLKGRLIAAVAKL